MKNYLSPDLFLVTSYQELPHVHSSPCASKLADSVKPVERKDTSIAVDRDIRCTEHPLMLEEYLF